MKWSIEPARAQDVPLAIARAYYIAMMPPRGPVLVSVPVDDWDRPRVRAGADRQHANFARIRRFSPRSAQRWTRATGRRSSSAPRSIATTRGTTSSRWPRRTTRRVWVAPMSGRCSFPEDHRLFAGFLPAMRERIVELLAGHDLILAIGAPAFAYHVEGAGPHVPAGATLCQLTDDPDTAAWTPVGISAVGSIRLEFSICSPGRRKKPAAVAAGQDAGTDGRSRHP